MGKLHANFNTLDVLKDNEKSDVLFEILEQVSLVGEEELNTIGCYVIDILMKHGLVINEEIMKILKNQKITENEKLKEDKDVKDVEEFEPYCYNCGNEDFPNNFTYEGHYANGYNYRCKDCKDSIMLSEKEHDEFFY